MPEKRKKSPAIPDDVKLEVEARVERFNQANPKSENAYYDARFKGKFCYLYRCDYGRWGPVCRLTYTGKMDAWEFAIFKWSNEAYDPDEWMFPGSNFVDGTVEGAMKAGMEAYSV
jgi:hypothetical protein